MNCVKDQPRKPVSDTQKKQDSDKPISPKFKMHERSSIPSAQSMDAPLIYLISHYGRKAMIHEKKKFFFSKEWVANSELASLS